LWGATTQNRQIAKSKKIFFLKKGKLIGKLFMPVLFMLFLIYYYIA
jgi:hypothetical protein